MILEFDEEAHEYKVEGVRLPSVTEILDYHKLIPQYPVGPYRTRGRMVHRATQLLDEGYEIVVGEKIAGYVESYKLAMKAFRFQWTSCETRLWHPQLFYAGTIDRIGTIRGLPCIADIKSGETGSETELQLAGYEILVRSEEPMQRFRIRLFSDGKPGKVTLFTDDFALEAFVGYLNTYKWEKRGKR